MSLLLYTSEVLSILRRLNWFARSPGSSLLQVQILSPQSFVSAWLTWRRLHYFSILYCYGLLRLEQQVLRGLQAGLDLELPFHSVCINAHFFSQYYPGEPLDRSQQTFAFDKVCRKCKTSSLSVIYKYALLPKAVL